MKLDTSIIIAVDEGVYEPSDDSILLLESVDLQPGMEVLEIGTGSGIIALHCAKTGAKVTATDSSVEAIENARKNALRNSLEVNFVLSNLFYSVGRDSPSLFDIIIFNPPYLMSEGTESLDDKTKSQISGGDSGAELSVQFLKEAKNHLTPGGLIYLLTSSESEAGVLEYARAHYNLQKVGEKKLFYEVLAVWKLTARK